MKGLDVITRRILLANPSRVREETRLTEQSSSLNNESPMSRVCGNIFKICQQSDRGQTGHPKSLDSQEHDHITNVRGTGHPYSLVTGRGEGLKERKAAANCVRRLHFSKFRYKQAGKMPKKGT